MKTTIKEYDRIGFEGMKFEFVCDGKYLAVEESPKKAIEWFKNFNGYEPKEVKQVSKYPSREQ